MIASIIALALSLERVERVR